MMPFDCIWTKQNENIYIYVDEHVISLLTSSFTPSLRIIFRREYLHLLAYVPFLYFIYHAYLKLVGYRIRAVLIVMRCSDYKWKL